MFTLWYAIIRYTLKDYPFQVSIFFGKIQLGPAESTGNIILYISYITITNYSNLIQGYTVCAPRTKTSFVQETASIVLSGLQDRGNPLKAHKLGPHMTSLVILLSAPETNTKCQNPQNFGEKFLSQRLEKVQAQEFFCPLACIP